MTSTWGASRWGSARRTRAANLHLWLAKWNTYAQCPDCHQSFGIPCLNLTPRSNDMYAETAHPRRPTIPETS